MDLRGCFIWTSWCSRAEGHYLWTSLFLEFFLLPRRLVCGAVTPLKVCFQRSSFSKQSSLQETAVLDHFFLSLPFPFYLGAGEGFTKKVKYLGWSSDDAGNTTLDRWPPHPTLKDEATQQDPGLPYSSFPDPGSWRSLPFKTLMHRRGFSPLLDNSRLLPEGSTQVWEMKWHWLIGNCWKN